MKSVFAGNKWLTVVLVSGCSFALGIVVAILVSIRVLSRFEVIDMMTLASTNGSVKLKALQFLDAGDTTLAKKVLISSMRVDSDTMHVLESEAKMRPTWRDVMTGIDTYLGSTYTVGDIGSDSMKDRIYQKTQTSGAPSHP